MKTYRLTGRGRAASPARYSPDVAQLAAEYIELIGYDPFDDDPATTADEIRQTLRDYRAEAGLNPDRVEE